MSSASATVDAVTKPLTSTTEEPVESVLFAGPA